MFRRKTTLSASLRRVVLAAWAGAAWMVGAAVGHENHAPLPTKGVKVTGDQITLSARAREAIGMTTEKIALGEIRRSVRALVRVELPAAQQVMVASLVPGRIEQVRAHPGERVAAGQEMARMTSPELESLQSDWIRAGTSVAYGRQQLERLTAASESGAVPGKRVLEVAATLAEQKARSETLKYKLHALGLEDATLRQVASSGRPTPWLSIVAPMSGTITHADVRAGQTIAPTDHLYHIVDLTTLWAVCEVLESDAGLLRKGQDVRIHCTVLAGRALAGKVDHVRLKMDPHTRTQAVVVAVENREGLLRPGMSGGADIEVQVAKEAVVCAADALIETRHAVYVLVERGEGKYVSQPVKLGLRSNGKVEVLDGVFPGDRVVVVGNYLLASLMGNEHKARVTAEASPSDGPDAIAAAGASRGVVIQATVELPTERQSYCSASVEGRIQRVLVSPSQAVQAGQVLAELESPKLSNLQLELLQTVSKIRWHRQSLERLESGGEPVVASMQQVRQLRHDLELSEQASAHLHRTLALLGLTEEQLRRLEQADLSAPGATATVVPSVPIRAAAGGIVASVDVVQGQIVQPQDKLIEVQDLSKVWAKGHVLERDASRIRVGQRVAIRFAAHPDLVVRGAVARHAPVMETSERVLPVWIEIDNPGLRLKHGMLASATVVEEKGSEDRQK